MKCCIQKSGQPESKDEIPRDEGGDELVRVRAQTMACAVPC